MKNKAKYFSVLFFVAVFLFFPKNDASAACTLNGPGTWSKNPAVVALNESVNYNLSGNQECANKNIIIEVYGKGGVDFRINTMVVRAGSTGNVVATSSFRASDFSGRSGDQTVYLKAKAEDGSSNQVTSSNLTVKLTTGGCGTPGQPACPPPGEIGVQITNFDISPKQVAVGATGNLLITFKLNISDPVKAKLFCNSNTFIWFVNVATNTGNQSLRSGQLAWPTSPQNYNLDFQDPFTSSSNGVVNFAGVVGCGSVGGKEIVRSTSVPLTVGTGGSSGGCGASGQPACRPGASQSFDFIIPNPLAGGADDFSELVKIIAQWLFNLAIPIAVAMIVYAGILFLTAAGEPAKVTKAKDVLKYAVIGLAIIMIGSGFISLIRSILELGSPTP